MKFNSMLFALLVGSLWLDRKVCLTIEALPHNDTFNAWRDLSEFGVAKFYILAAIILTLIFFGVRLFTLAEFCFFGLVNFLLSGLIVVIVKTFVGRVRPHVAPDFTNIEFDPLNFNHLHQSFPSGHTQTVFSFAFWIALRYPQARVPSLIFACLIASSRIARNVHFLSDVIGGVLVAWLGLQLTTYLFARLRRIFFEAGGSRGLSDFLLDLFTPI